MIHRRSALLCKPSAVLYVVNAGAGAGVWHDPAGTRPLREKPSQMVDCGMDEPGGVTPEEDPAPPHAVSMHTTTEHTAVKTVERNTITPRS
jgi:hypothetical protein